MKVEKVAVLGSGVMGSAIAALMANAGVPVLLLDIVPPNLKPGESRNGFAEKAIEKMLGATPSAFTHKHKAKLVTPGNLEDDLEKLKDVVWIVEAVLEKIEIKQEVYRKIDSVRKKGSVISSNTSTLPMQELLKGLPESFAADFLITHFFNPPRFMRLLELAANPKTRPEAHKVIAEFAEATLGKGVVECKDTPGFIANRIGVYWLMAGLLDAMALGITVEEADAVMGKPVGIPKTGVFGLFDLIGIDLMPLIAKAMTATLPESDPFRQMYREPDLVKKMIADGYTGRKGRGGFYRLNKEGGKKTKEVIDLKTGEYHPEKKTSLESVDAAKAGLAALVSHPDIGGRYAKSVLLKTLWYAASLIPEISDDIVRVDEAIRWGYNWKYGPFELIDRLKTPQDEGTAVFAQALEEAGLSVPEIIQRANRRPLYRTSPLRGRDEAGRETANSSSAARSAGEGISINTSPPTPALPLEGGEGNSVRQYMTLWGEYGDIKQKPGELFIANLKLGGKPVKKTGSASLWDMGDGIACLEFTSKMNSIDPDILSLMEQSVEIVGRDFKGLVIGSDADNFSVGANLAFILMAANMAAWNMIGDVIRQGQRAVMGLKYAPFPVVSALHGMALGGGCETVLHSNAVQAHVESYPGLVEVGVGVIPAWGGCKEMLLRNLDVDQSKDSKNTGVIGGVKNAIGTLSTMPGVSKAFEQIVMAKVAGSAEEARDMNILRKRDRITMNRARLLQDAKNTCLEIEKEYAPPIPASLSLPGKTGHYALMMAVDGFVKSGKATPHDAVIARHLAYVLTGGDTDITEQVSEQQLLDLEYEAFMELLKTTPTLARIEHMLDTGKPLRN